MNFGKRFNSEFARGSAQTEEFAQAGSTLARGDSTLLKIEMSPQVEVEARLGRSGAYPALEWLNALTERLRRAAASRAVVYAVFTVIYLVPTLWLAKYKLMWDDEFFTLYLARGGWQSLMAGLATGADQHPPPFYYLTHWIFQLFGMSHITLRLPAIVGFWILCVCLYEIIRRQTIPMWGVVAMLLPLSTQIYYYATEARGYGLVTGFSAMAVLAWIKATEPRWRAVFLPMLAISLACAVSSHYYAVLILISLAAGELMRTRALGRIDVPVWIAFAFAFLPVAVFLPTIRSARQYSAHFWAVPAWSDALSFYSTKLGLASVPLIGFLAAGLLFGFGTRGWRAMNSMRGHYPEGRLHERATLPPWQATALFLLAATPVTAMLVAKFATHAFSPRYAICSIVGIATLATYLVSRVAPRALTAMVAAMLCLIMYGLEIRILLADFRGRRAGLVASAEALSRTSDAQIALMDITVMHQLSYYTPRDLAARVNFVADPEKSIEYLGEDTIDRGLLDLRPWFPLKVVRVESFLADNPRFLAYGGIYEWSWLPYDLPKWGETRLIARVDGQRMLFSIDHVHVPHSERLAEQRADQTPMLFKQMPRVGPSLCALWMGPNNCPRLR
jgi:hypothetical protein